MSVRYDWSKLCPDLLRSILELKSLSNTDFYRARSVCSNWYTVSRTCSPRGPRSLYPWRLLFDKHSTSVFDPVEDKIHEIEHPGLDLSSSCVMASCSSWLLMVDLHLQFYLENVFTGERINLPLTESSSLVLPFQERWAYFMERTSVVSSENPACLWINEITKDYVVAWSYEDNLFSYKKGDDSWRDHQGIGCVSMAYKEDKLYVFTIYSSIKILDFYGDSPKEVIQGNPYPLFYMPTFVWKTRIAITRAEEVLIVLSLRESREEDLFSIFKMNSRSNQWERVDSLGGEMMIFGHGVTIRAPIEDISGCGITSDTICFRDGDLFPSNTRETNCGVFDLFPRNRRETNCGVFDLLTRKITSLHVRFLESFWFVPGYA